MNQLKIGKDMRVELQIPPSLNRHFRAAEENLRLGGEKRVITGSEQETAKKLGEIKEGEVTRTNHNGTLYPTNDPTSTNTATIIEGNKDDKKKDRN